MLVDQQNSPATIRKSRGKDASVIKSVKIDEVLRIRGVVQQEHRLGYIEIWGKHRQGWVKLRSIHHLAARVSDLTFSACLQTQISDHCYFFFIPQSTVNTQVYPTTVDERFGCFY